MLESEDHVKHLQRLLAGKDEQLQKLTSRLDAGADYKAVRETVASLAIVAETVQNKTEQVGHWDLTRD